MRYTILISSFFFLFHCGFAQTKNAPGQMIITTSVDGIWFLNGKEQGKISKNDVLTAITPVGDNVLELKTQTGEKIAGDLVYVENGIQKFFMFTKNNRWIDFIVGDFEDTRDKKKYKILSINNRLWMASALKYSSPTVNATIKNVNNYFYTWEQAKQACPDGWRLATEEDWKSLFIWVGEGFFSTRNGIQLHKVGGWSPFLFYSKDVV